MNEFDYLVFVNDAKEPIAGFAYSDQARAWAEEHYRNRYEIREATQPDRDHPSRVEGAQPELCAECGKYPADPPSKICVGCAAYREHTAA